MKLKKHAREILKETELKFEEVKAMPDNLFYLNLYHSAHALNSMGKHKLCINICEALLKEFKDYE